MYCHDSGAKVLVFRGEDSDYVIFEAIEPSQHMFLAAILKNMAATVYKTYTSFKLMDVLT